MDGDIGILSSGAGITMAIMDLIHLGGGKPANFLDTAQMNRQGIYDAFQIFHGSAKIKVLLVNIFAGLNRCDELALGIRDYLNAFRPSFPIVVRMIGNRENEGREILKEIGITPIAGLEEAVDRAIALVR
jgi:succinyl-CoA synthetase beta subunit